MLKMPFTFIGDNGPLPSANTTNVRQYQSLTQVLLTTLWSSPLMISGISE
jgi:hypothetical protein